MKIEKLKIEDFNPLVFSLVRESKKMKERKNTVFLSPVKGRCPALTDREVLGFELMSFNKTPSIPLNRGKIRNEDFVKHILCLFVAIRVIRG
ncbi:MAG: hypothetical protein Q7J16_06905 [Candidatus Cloacimonadales bacterium]|nr:hypothetical protein [Candidatus Cloacimonadales bacterium]